MLHLAQYDNLNNLKSSTVLQYFEFDDKITGKVNLILYYKITGMKLGTNSNELLISIAIKQNAYTS